MEEIKNQGNPLNLERLFSAFLNVLPYSVALCRRDGSLLFYNKNFVYTLPFLSKSKIEEQPNCDYKIQDIVCQQLSEQLHSVELYKNREILDKITINELELLPSIYLLEDGEYFVLMLRNICDKDIVHEEFIAVIESIISENYLMIQNISQVMGETSVKRVKLLKSMINSLR